MVNKDRFQYLMERFQLGQLTAEQRDELGSLLDNESEETLVSLIREMIETTTAQPAYEDSGRSDERFQRIVGVDKATIAQEEQRLAKGKIRRLGSKGIAAIAASVLILVSLGLYQFFQRPVPEPTSQTAKGPEIIQAPSSNRAVLTLADGRQVYLDSAGNGSLAVLGNIKLEKLANGQIAYRASNGSLYQEMVYNTLTNPKGSRVIDVGLTDGTHIWLNAGSSITYPVAFAATSRSVELNGEAYFEVARDPGRVFIVNANGSETQVLGTHFNINAYQGERDIRVTLIEGSVKVSGQNAAGVVIEPGQQANLSRSGIEVRKADIEDVMSWKNGYFNLDGQRLDEIMRQLERWYNIEVIYTSAEVPEIELLGKLGRDLSLNELVNSLKDMGVACKIQSNRLYVE